MSAGKPAISPASRGTRQPTREGNTPPHLIECAYQCGALASLHLCNGLCLRCNRLENS